VKASAQYLRVTPRKARLVVEHIRGRSVPEARTVLAFTPRAAAREIEKILASAVANAEANHGLLGDDLMVSAAYVDEGPVIKRWRARARGRVARIKKRTCHVTLRLAPVPDADGTPTRRAAPTTADAPTPEEQKATEEPKAEETKPKPRRTRKPAAKKPATPKAEAEKPKPKRAPRKKKETEE
jgi:large subunit ribosomal protein L22